MNNELNTGARKGPKFHYAFLVFITCCSITFVSVALYFSCNGIFYTPVSEYFGVGRGVFAIAGTVMSIVMGFFSPIVGGWIEKYSFKKLMIIFLIIQIIAYVIQSRAGSILVFYFTGILHGVIHALFMTLVVPTVINRWFEVKRGLFVGLASSMSGVGGIVWNAVAGRFMEAYGWQNTYMLYAVLVACIPLPLCLFVLKDRPEDIGLKPYGYSDIPGATVSTFKQDASAIRGLTAKEAQKKASFWLLAGMSLSTGIVCCFVSYIPSYATSLGQSISFGATLASIMGLGILVGKNCSGMIFDKNVKLGVIVANLLPGIGTFLFIVFGMTAPQYMPIASILFGVCYAGNPVLLPLLIVEIFGSKEYAKIIGLINMYNSLAGAGLGIVFGFVSDIPGGAGFIILLAVCTAAAVAGTICALLAVKKGEDLF